MRAKNADFTLTVLERVEMASSMHTVCCSCACAVQTKHYTALFSPGGLNKHLPARMAKLYEVPISFFVSLCSFFKTMSPRLTEDRDLSEPSLQKQKRTRAMFVYGMFYEVVYQKLRVPRFGVQCIPGRSPPHVAPPPYVPPRAARPGVL